MAWVAVSAVWLSVPVLGMLLERVSESVLSLKQPT